jgi:hypothetical protein
MRDSPKRQNAELSGDDGRPLELGEVKPVTQLSALDLFVVGIDDIVVLARAGG